MKILKNSFLTIYLVLIACIYPLYIHDGYYDLYEVKRNFLYWVSTVSFFIFLPIIAIDLFHKSSLNLKNIISWKKINITEKFLIMYSLMIIISYLFSDFKYEVLWGTEGWDMGTIILLLMNALTLIISYLYKDKKLILYYYILSSSIVFALAVCNRFSFYPIMWHYLPTFISTIGNINWFCGYMSVVAPIGIGLYFFSDKDFSIQKILLLFYCLLTFITGFCQGSLSVLLWEGCLFFLLLWISLEKMKLLQNWLILLFLWGLSGQIVRIIKYFLPDYYNYGHDGSVKLIDTNFTLLIAVLALAFYILLRYKEKNISELTADTFKKIHTILLVCPVVFLLIYIILSAVNTKFGIPFLAENSFFIWNKTWGTDRGMCFFAAFLILNKMSFLQKLIGVGADGFCAFAYSDPVIAEHLNNFFEDELLGNAHNDILTSLIHFGILGTIAYIGVFLTFFMRCMKHGKKDSTFYIFALCVASYFANNMVSFAQIYSTPHLFILLGIGGAYLRKIKS